MRLQKIKVIVNQFAVIRAAPVAFTALHGVAEQRVIHLFLRFFRQSLLGIFRRHVHIAPRTLHAQFAHQRQAASALLFRPCDFLRTVHGVIEILSGEHDLIFQHGFDAREMLLL